MPAKLTFPLEARELDHAVPFDVFAEMTARIANVLGELDNATPGEPSVRWLISDLRIGSAEVVLEAEPLNPLLDTSARIARQFSSGLRVIATQRMRPEWFTDSAWEDAHAMVGALHDGVRRLAELLEAAGPPAEELVSVEEGIHRPQDPLRVVQGARGSRLPAAAHRRSTGLLYAARARSSARLAP